MKMNPFHMRLAVYPVAPWLLVNPSENEISGPIADVVHYIFRPLNITYSLHTPEKPGSGILLSNGTWTGVLGMLQNNNADLSPVPLVMAEDKLRYFYLLYPFTYTEFTILSAVTRRNRISASELNIQPNIVYMTFVSLFVVITVLSIIDKRMERNSRMSTLFVNNFFRLFGTLALRSPFLKYNSGTARRLLMIFWWLPIIVLMTTLVSLLISSMATVSYELIDGLKDFDKFPNICPTTNFGGHYQNFLETSTDENAIRIWKRILECGTLVARSDLLTRRRFQDVVDKKIALLYDTESLLHAVHDVCDREKMLHIATNQMETVAYTFYVRKGFPWKLYEELNYRMMRYFEGGWYHSKVNGITHRAERCLKREKKPSCFITIGDMKMNFYAWFIGVAISCVSFLLEIMFRLVFERTGTASRRVHSERLRRRRNVKLVVHKTFIDSSKVNSTI